MTLDEIIPKLEKARGKLGGDATVFDSGWNIIVSVIASRVDGRVTVQLSEDELDIGDSDER